VAGQKSATRLQTQDLSREGTSRPPCNDEARARQVGDALACAAATLSSVTRPPDAPHVRSHPTRSMATPEGGPPALSRCWCRKPGL